MMFQRCLVLAIGLVAGSSAIACTSAINAKRYPTLRKAFEVMDVGDYAIGILPKGNGFGGFVPVKDGSCLNLPRSKLKPLSSLPIFFKKNGNFADQDMKSTFIVFHAIAIAEKWRLPQPITLQRIGPKITQEFAWSKNADGSAPFSDGTQSYAVTSDPDRLTSITDRAEFEKVVPGFLPYFVEKRSSGNRTEDTWPSILAARLSPNYVKTLDVPGYDTRHTIYLIGLDVGEGRSVQSRQEPDPVASGPCVYISVQSSDEKFRKRSVIDLSGVNICKDIQ